MWLGILSFAGFGIRGLDRSVSATSIWFCHNVNDDDDDDDSKVNAKFNRISVLEGPEWEQSTALFFL